MVERAQPRGRDDEHRRGELRGDVGERAAVVVEPDEEPARTLDEHQIVLLGQLQCGRDRRLRRNGRASRAPRGGRGRQRIGIAGELPRGHAGNEAGHLGEITRLVGSDAGLDGLEDRHPAGRERRDRRRDHGLADTGPGTGDDQDHRCSTVDKTSARTAPARASSTSVSVARAVSRSLLVPFGTDGGRKQPTRSPRSAHAAAAATAMSGSPNTTDTTADGGAGTPAAAASAAAALSIAAGRSGSARSTRKAASAAPTHAGARPVSKMNERAVSTRCAITAADPTHRAALAAQRL